MGDCSYCTVPCAIVREVPSTTTVVLKPLPYRMIRKRKWCSTCRMRNNVLLSAPLESDGEDGADEMDEVDSDGAGDSSALALSQDYLGTTTMDIQE